MPEQPVTSHREAKKSRTRAAISEAALSLFAQQGYAATTVAQIAHEAGVAPRTVFTYVESKEALLFEWLREPLERLEVDLRERPHGGDSLTEFGHWLLHDYHPVAARHARTITDDLLADDAPVAAYALRIQDRVETWMRAALATDLGCAPSDPAVHLAAAAIVGAFAQEPADGASASSRRVQAQYADDAITFVRHGLAALGHPNLGPATAGE